MWERLSTRGDGSSTDYSSKRSDFHIWGWVKNVWFLTNFHSIDQLTNTPILWSFACRLRMYMSGGSCHYWRGMAWVWPFQGNFHYFLVHLGLSILEGSEGITSTPTWNQALKLITQQSTSIWGRILSVGGGNGISFGPTGHDFHNFLVGEIGRDLTLDVTPTKDKTINSNGRHWNPRRKCIGRGVSILRVLQFILT